MRATTALLLTTKSRCFKMPNPVFFNAIRSALQAPLKTLVVLDENPSEFTDAIVGNKQLHCLSNRFDVAQSLTAEGADVVFSDFDFHGFEADSFDQVVYRVSKERPVVHHVINQAGRILKVGGELLLVGHKQEGIQTHIDRAQRHLGNKARVEKEKQSRLAWIKRREVLGAALDDKDYAQLRPAVTTDFGKILSKPGLYGWNKEDQGSRLLLSLFAEQITNGQFDGKRLLDIGCGYGYLSIGAAQHHAFQQVIACDNNAAALLACRANLDAFEVAGEVVASDVSDQVDGRFDLVLCNPPFHQGFHTEQALSKRFLQGAAKHLSKNGEAWFVVNQFLPADTLAREFFAEVQVIGHNKSFKVLRLRQPRH